MSPLPDPHRFTATAWRVRLLAPHEPHANDIAAWADLEARAAEPNAYLSPHFVLPALRHLDAGAPAVIAMVAPESGPAREIVGLGVFRRSAGSRLLPLPHLVGYRSRHSFLGGVLLDAHCAEPALRAMLRELQRSGVAANGVELPQCWGDGALAGLAAAFPGAIVHHDPVSDRRAVLRPAHAAAGLHALHAAGHLGGLERKLRRLRTHGQVSWRCHRERGMPAAVVEAFVALEHAGWKGEALSSLRAKPADEAFFREAVERFAAERRALFTELVLDERPVASLSHFVSGREAFAFKIGWAPELAAHSPGWLHEIEFMRHAGEAFADLRQIDSGAGPCEYINALWREQRPLATVVLPFGAIARVAASSASQALLLRRRWQQRGRDGAAKAMEMR